MPRLRSESELEALRAKAVALDQKIRKVAARARAKREEEDHRRYLLVGQAALEHMTDDSAFAATMMALIDRQARSVPDRALFELPPIAKDQAANSSTPPSVGGHDGARMNAHGNPAADAAGTIS